MDPAQPDQAEAMASSVLLQGSGALLDTFSPGTHVQITNMLVPALSAHMALHAATEDVTHLDKVIEYASAALDGMTPGDDPAYEDIFQILSDAHLTRGHRSRSRADVDKALQLLLHPSSVREYNAARKGKLSHQAGRAYMLSYGLFNHYSDLDSAIEHFTTAVDMFPSTSTVHHDALESLEEAYWVRFLCRGDADDWNAAGRCYMRHVALAGGVSDAAAGAASSRDDDDDDDDDDGDAAVAELVHHVELQFQASAASHSPGSFFRLAKRLRDFLNAAPPAHPNFLEYAGEFGRLCIVVFKTSVYLEAILDMGIAQLMTAIRTGDERHHNVITCLGYLSDCYSLRYSKSRHHSDLNSAIRHLGVAIDKVAQFGLPPRGYMLYKLSALHHARFAIGDQRSDFETSLKLARESCAEEFEDNAAAYTRTIHLSSLYHTKAIIDKSVHYIDAAVERLVEAYDLYSNDPSDQNEAAQSIVVNLRWKAETTGRVEDLEEALRWGRKLLPNISKQDPFIPAFLQIIDDLREKWSKLVGAGTDDTTPQQVLELADQYAAPRSMIRRQHQLETLVQARVDDYLQHGDSSSIEQAIEAHDELFDMYPKSIRILGSEQMQSKADLLLLKFDGTGDATSLDQASRGFKSALTLTSFRSTSRVRALIGLAHTHLRRYERDGAMADLEYAIELYEEAEKSHFADDSMRRTCFCMLALLYDARYRREKNPDDMVKSLDLHQQARACMPAHDPDFPIVLRNSAISRHEEFIASGDMVQLDGAIQDLRQASSLLPPTHRDQPLLLQGLGGFYQEKFDVSGQLEDLEESINLFTQVLQSTPGHSGLHARANLRLGLSYVERFKLETEPTAETMLAKQTQDLLRKVVESPAAQPLEKFTAYWKLNGLHHYLDNAEAAADAVPQWASLMPLITPQSLDIPDKQYIMARISFASQRMTATLLRANRQPCHALEVLESVRGVIVSSLGAVRGPVSELRKRHRHLAEDYLKCRRALDQSALYAERHLPSAQFAGIAPPGVDHRYVASEKLERTMIAIRRLDGFERFQLPLTEGEFRAAASSGPIAVLNVDDYRSDALVIRTTGISTIPLPDLHFEDIYWFEARLSPSAMTMALLEWLWDAVAEPVLRHLGFDAAPALDAPWPRMRWVVTGRLGKFPIHAAGYHDQNGLSVLDRVISSYSFSLGSIVQSLKAAPFNASDGPNAATKRRSIMLLRAGRLSFVPKEISRLERLWSGIQVHKPSSCRSEALECLKDSDIFHFAGHGYTHPTDPLNSALILDQDTLPLQSLLNIDLQSRKPFLAYLSACGTGRIRRNELLDEGLHLVTALQVCGFRHVIGTLWDVDDEACVDVSADTYSWMQSHGMNDQAVSEGLHHAIRRLRDKCSRRPVEPSTSEHTHSTCATNQIQRDPDSQKQHNGQLLDNDDDDDAALGRRLRALGLGAVTLPQRGHGGHACVKMEDAQGTSWRDMRRVMTADCDEMPFHWVPYVHFGV